FSSELFCIFAGDFFAFAKRMVLGKISVHCLVARKRKTDAGGDQAMWFLRGIFADYRECHLPWPDVLQSFAARNQFAIWWKNRGDAHDVARCDACIAQGQLKTGKPLTMF